MSKHAHRHRAIASKRKTVCYDHPVSERSNPIAWGGVMHTDACSCGAIRETNSTGPGRVERGAWIEPAGEGRANA